MSDVLNLSIPAKADYLLTARLTASSLGARLGYSIEEIEDLKTAVAEGCLAIMHSGYFGKLEISYDIDEKRLAVVIEGLEPGTGIPTAAGSDPELSQYLLEAMVDTVKFKRLNDRVCKVTFIKEKDQE